jgi:hypothetical protein
VEGQNLIIETTEVLLTPRSSGSLLNLSPKIGRLLRTRAKMIAVQFLSPDGGVVDRPTLMIAGSAAAQARVLAEREKSRDSLPCRVANADAPSHSPVVASLSPDPEMSDTPGVDHGAE